MIIGQVAGLASFAGPLVARIRTAGGIVLLIASTIFLAWIGVALVAATALAR